MLFAIGALVVIVGSMSIATAAILGVGGVLAGAIVWIRGAFEPRIDVHSAAFDEQLRGFFDDAA